MAGQCPLITFYTPTYERPSMLRRCQASLELQTCQDYEHVIVHDEIGIGIAGMFAEIPEHLDLIHGRYVYVLTDDNMLADNEVVGKLKEEVERLSAKVSYPCDLPAVLIVKCFLRGGVYPIFWEEENKEAQIDLGNYLVRADVFRKHADKFGHRYAGDYDFIHFLWGRYPFVWIDLLFARSQLRNPGLGRPEQELLAEIGRQ
jgi:glycosyltransferase involved in cell wall biosynthesis